MSEELADLRAQSRESGRQLAMELASTRSAAAAAEQRIDEQDAQLAAATQTAQDLARRLQRCGTNRARV